MGTCIRRGLVAGLVAGVAAGLWFFVLGEPQIERALTFEAVPPDPSSVEVFSRTVQRAGLSGATALYGMALGGVFGFLYPILAPRFRSGSSSQRSLRLALAGYAAIWFVPFLKYPTNPPGVGDPNTINQRTWLYVAMLGVSIAAAVGAWMALRALAERGVGRHRRQLAVGVAYLAVIGAAYGLLPPNTDPILIPANILWSTRVVSAAGQALLWTLLGAVFGLLTLRADRASDRARASTQPLESHR
jgi:predicted cobalt transporter CbtA